jgi:hypothetical protein
MTTRLILVFMAMAIILGGCGDMKSETNIAAETEAIRTVINNSIGWAATKDRELSFSLYSHDPELFWFSPRDDGTVHGFKAFQDVTDGIFMRDEFQHVSFDIRDLQINLSESGTVAWYHARLDDYNTWAGQPANWEDVRWTGVLEKRAGKWVIVQMHFSRPSDREEG